MTTFLSNSYESDSIDSAVEKKKITELVDELESMDIMSSTNLPSPPTHTVTFNPDVRYASDDEPPASARSSGFFNIAPNTPAAKALHANAEIRVTKFSKFKRKAKIPTVRKYLKKAASFKNPNASKRGKPPRVGSNALKKRFHSEPQITVPFNPNIESDDEEMKDSHDDDADGIDLESNDKIDTNHSKDPSTDLTDNEKRRKKMKENQASSMASIGSEASRIERTLERTTSFIKKRNQRRQKKGRNYVKGKVIDGEHELYALSLAVMLGIKFSLNRTNKKLAENRKWLDSYDFMAVEKYTFPPKGGPRYGIGPKTPSHDLAHTFKIKEYSPLAFAYIRKMFGVIEKEFLSSVCGNTNFIEFISNAKSGQFFFFSADGKYMIKTMTNAESKFLRRILPHYFRHCAKNPNTTVTRFFGMYRVKMYHLRRNVKFVIMNCVFDTKRPIHAYFDLKGSVTGRTAKPNQDVKKDNDLRALLPGGAIALPPEIRQRLRLQIQKDCNFLKQMKIMDYSMLIAVHNMNSNKSQASTRKKELENQKHNMEDMEDASHSLIEDDDEDYFSLLGDYDKRDEKKYNEVDKHDDNDDPIKSMENMKRDKAKDLFWPFHRLYDLHGRRLLSANPDDFSLEEADETNKFYHTELIAPISNRVDGGLIMDDTGIELPFESQIGNKTEPCEGKIFYMGIIDLLQQFNGRKRIEAKLRRLTGSGWAEASCVHPNLYADRFLTFFDEYSTRTPNSNTSDVINSLSEDENDVDDLKNVEEITFTETGNEVSFSSPLFSSDEI